MRAATAVADTVELDGLLAVGTPVARSRRRRFNQHVSGEPVVASLLAGNLRSDDRLLIATGDAAEHKPDGRPKTPPIDPT